MCGNGELWASAAAAPRQQTLRILAINLPQKATATAAGAHAAPGGAAIVPATTQLDCRTDKFQILIEAAREEPPRYRSWNRPHGPPDTPAMELVGKVDGEGTGLCLHRRWRFANGNVDFVLSEPGCSEGNVPAKAKALLEVRVAAKTRLSSWCD